MSTATKGILAVVGFFLIGFLIVGTSEKSEEEKKNESFVTGFATLSKTTTMRCKSEIKKHTGANVYFPTETKTDKNDYMTLIWKNNREGFKDAECTFTRSKGTVTRLVIDGKTYISK
ncbi:hypothetical protein [Thiolapillus sp.]|uniref:hypothetical protein n=1 Tax=Thiolapillus sp. TaxID=2017437 RepID=UPI003AF93113